MKKLKVALCAAALATSSIGWAQDGKAAQVKQFLDLQRPGIELLARGMTQDMSDPIAAAGAEYLRTKVPAEKREAVGKNADVELKKYFDENYPYVRDKALQAAPGTLGPVLEQNFSEEELRQLNAWISSPLSKKYQESTQTMQKALAEKLYADIRSTMEPKLRTLDADVARALGASPGATGAAPAKAPAKK
jgi:uncharacterized protein